MSSRGYRRGSEAKYADTVGLDVDEEDDDSDYNSALASGSSGVKEKRNRFHHEEGLSISATTFIAGNRQMALPGGPFSAVTPSMWPQDVLARIQQLDECRDQPEYRYDEFGFKVEVEDGPEQNSSKILSTPFVEDPQHRLKWIAYLEFTHNQVVEDLTWDKIDPLLPKSDKLAQMIRAGGVPHSLRPHIWPRLCGSLSKKKRANFSYKDLVKSANKDRPAIARQIEKDLLRTMPNNACFMHLDSTGVPRLRRILRALAYLYPEIGYCQGMGVIVGTLLLFLEEEDTFWAMVTVIEDYLPASYFSQSLLGLQADQRVLRQLIGSFLPDTEAVLAEHDIELSLISLHWFLTLFANVLHIRIVLRLWDLFFYEGSSVMFRAALGMLKMREKELKSTTNSADIFNLLSDLPGTVDDADYLLDISYKVAGSLNEIMIASHRKKHLAYLMVDHGVLIGNPERASNLPKERINRRKLKRSQSLVSQIFASGADTSDNSSPDIGRLKRGASIGFLNGVGLGGSSYTDYDDLKLKNVRQTEILVDLKEAILKVARHFLTVDPSSHQKINLQPDYSLESHARDHENYLAIHRSRRKRARALLDFERHDDDELGFRRNDVITIVSQKDEHCWIGELNGLRGWFPAKFVELLDERSKQYSCLGDDAVSEAITDLVRGGLCSALKAVFEHGIKRSTVLGGPCHPWLFIEDVANEEVRKDFRSVYSRLVLCKTFRLDEDGKVLTPEELLYKCVQQVNFTHDPRRVQMDVKFRSMICLGLNEQALHLWFELLCSNQDVVRKWYHPWSFIRSPGWVQIKCELRVLSQFAFNLSCDWELPSDQRQRQILEKPLKEGVRDMLVKHHLFSWDL